MDVTIVIDDDPPSRVQVEVLSTAGERAEKARVDGSAVVVTDLVAPALVTLRAKSGVWTGWLEATDAVVHVALDGSTRCQVLDADDAPMVGVFGRAGRVTDAHGFLGGCASTEPVHVPSRFLATVGAVVSYPERQPGLVREEGRHSVVVGGRWTPIGEPIVEERPTAAGFERRRIDLPVDAPPTYGPWTDAPKVRLTEAEPFVWTPNTAGLAWRDEDGTIAVFPREFPTIVRGTTPEGREITALLEAGDVERPVRARRAEVCWRREGRDEVRDQPASFLFQRRRVTAIGGASVDHLTAEQAIARVEELGEEGTITVRGADGAEAIWTGLECKDSSLVVGGIPGGVIGGGPPGGVLGGASGAPKTFHSSDMQVKARVVPTYPDAAKALNLGDVDCRVRIAIDRNGVPQRVEFVACPDAFHQATEDAVLASRWYPQKDHGTPIDAQFVLMYRYSAPRLDSPR